VTTDKKWWTILVLAPKDTPPVLRTEYRSISEGTNLWVVMLYHIHHFTEMASQSWVKIKESFEQLLLGASLRNFWLKTTNFPSPKNFSG
jgi:hypothetical protein